MKTISPPPFHSCRKPSPTANPPHWHAKRGFACDDIYRWLRIFIPRDSFAFGSLMALLLLINVPFETFAEKPVRREVVVYCALDQPYAQPLLDQFQKERDIVVKTIFDSEATKTAGLVNRILAEKQRPVCDVFWNNEKLRTVLLAQKGLLSKFEPEAWKTRSLPHDEKNQLWTEFAARIRVVVFRTDRPELKTVHGPMTPLTEAALLTGPSFKGKIAFAHPLFGSTSTQFLFWMNRAKARGEDPEVWLKKVTAFNPLLCQGNSDVVRKVVQGHADFGFTDSDDVLAAMARGDPVDFYFPVDEQEGPLMLPNTLAIIQGAPHRKEAEELVNFLTSEASELALATGASSQIPLGSIRSAPTTYRAVFSKGNHVLSHPSKGNEETLVKTLESDLELLRKAFQK